MASKKHFLTAVTLAFAGALIAAAPRLDAAPVQSTSAEVSFSLSAENQQKRNFPPVEICILQDQSLSTRTTRTQQVRLDELDSVVNLLRLTGGEIGFGLISDNSNRSLKRLRVEAPPPALVKPPEKGNPFMLAKLKTAYNKELAEHKEMLTSWEAETAKRIQNFEEQIRPLIQQRADARTTDIWSAVSRCDLFLSENGASWSRPARRYAVFITDGIHDARTKFVPIKSGAKVIVVNGSASLGNLEILEPIRFESAEAAFRFIIAERGSH